jgi:acetylornithine deacetylase/succinyl-diaminopimelate desuccinylase-like protein
VAVPHFYDRVIPLSRAEEEALDMGFDQEEYSTSFGVGAFAWEEGISPRQANWLRPTVEINGCKGGYTDEGFKTVIPATASAKLSCRLVPRQDSEEIASHLASYLREQLPAGARLDITLHPGAPAFRTSPRTHVIGQAALAFEEVFGRRCWKVLEGGSVPIVPELARLSGAETALLGVALIGDNIHSPDEHFDMERFEKGFLSIARLLDRLASAHPQGPATRS